MDDLAASDTIPSREMGKSTAQMEHEATGTLVSQEQLFYLMSRGLDEEAVTGLIVLGFIKSFTRELPMEFAVEMNRLIRFEMAGAAG